MKLNLTPEFYLLCQAARPVSLVDMGSLRGAIAATSDWPAVIEGARRNRVTAMVLASMQSSNSSRIPPDVLAELHRQTIISVGHSLRQVAALQSLCATLNQADIQFLIVKGIPLSLQLYGDATRRAADDIDVLVSPTKFFRADTVLTQSGYRCDTELRSSKRRQAYTHWVKDLRYTDERSKSVIELHHRLTANPYLLEWKFDDLWRDRSHVRAGSTEAATLPVEKLLLYLLTHGANHGWERLRWLVDLTAVLQKPGATENAVAEAERVGLGAAMLQALALANELLGFPADPRHLDRARNNAEVKRLNFCLRQFLGRTLWRRRPKPNSWEWLWRFSIWFFLYNLSLKADWRYRGYQCAAMWVHPADWDAVRLPAALSWMYPIIRPFGWLMRRLLR